MNLPAERSNIEKAIIKTSNQFKSIKGNDELVFAQERRFFAMQVKSNKDLQNADTDSMVDAFLQAASLGLTLNPVTAHCYLIPRRARRKNDGESWDDYKAKVPIIVYPSPGYRGLLHLAVESGSILWAHADVIYKNDVFNYLGTTQEPEHKFDVFKDRGKMVGVYVVAKTTDGAYLTEVMTAEQIKAVRDRSEMKSSLMWKSFPEEAWKKAVIRRAQKTWPRVAKSHQLMGAVELLNKYEGIDHARTDYQDATGSQAPDAVVVISDEQHNELFAMVAESGREDDETGKWLQRLGKTFGAVRIQDLPADKFDEAKAKLKDALANHPVESND